METLKIDRTKLITVRNYAASKKVTTQQVYNWIKQQKVKIEVIDGVTFIYLD
jgi:phage antirepressor YoqD-like protein